MKALIGLLTLGLLLLLVIIIVGVVSSNSELATSALPSPGLPAAAATLALTPTVSKTLTPTISTLALTAIPTLTEVPVGQAYDRPFNNTSARVKVIRTADPPIVSLETALKALYAQHGMPNAQITISGNRLTVNGYSFNSIATYGLVTYGEPGPDGRWAGAVNISFSSCTIEGKCTPTGEVVDHLENRLMWVLDGEKELPSAWIPGTPAPCQANIPCPTTPPRPNRVVTLIDAKTLTSIGGTSYYKSN